MKRLPASPSQWTAIAVAGILVFTVFNLSKWRNEGYLKHDMYVYYNYLPALFIYDDLSFSYRDQLPETSKAEIWCLPLPEGGCVQKMTVGMAMLYAPFFAGAHFLAEPLGHAPSGYSDIYHQALALAALFYAIFGLFLLRRLLLRYFEDRVVAVVLPILYLGTNLFFYIAHEGVMSHQFNFFLSIVWMCALVKLEETKRFSWALVGGLALGLLTVIRPTNILFLGLYLLYGVSSWSGFQARVGQVLRDWKSLVGLALGGFCMVLPQLIYWKTVTGSWVYYSYGDEGFFFGDPAFFKGLFSFRKGWLLYTPLMALALVGLAVKHPWKYPFRTGAALLTGVLLYVTFSWWCWWYGGSYGQRSLIDLYAVLAFPLAALLERLRSLGRSVRIVAGTVIVLLIGLNQFQTFQYKRGILHYDSMTARAYVGIFGRIHYPPGYDQLVEPPDYEAAKRGER